MTGCHSRQLSIIERVHKNVQEVQLIPYLQYFQKL